MALLLFASCVHAQDQAPPPSPRNWIVIGLGAGSCAAYLKALDQNQPGDPAKVDDETYYSASDAYMQWIEGFVSALDYLHRPAPDRTQIDVQGVALWIKEFCKSSPGKPVLDAVLAFDRSGVPDTQGSGR